MTSPKTLSLQGDTSVGPAPDAAHARQPAPPRLLLRSRQAGRQHKQQGCLLSGCSHDDGAAANPNVIPNHDGLGVLMAVHPRPRRRIDVVAHCRRRSWKEKKVRGAAIGVG